MINTEARAFTSNTEEQIEINGSKLKQVASEIQESKQNHTPGIPGGQTPLTVACRRYRVGLKELELQ